MPDTFKLAPPPKYLFGEHREFELDRLSLSELAQHTLLPLALIPISAVGVVAAVVTVCGVILVFVVFFSAAKFKAATKLVGVSGLGERLELFENSITLDEGDC